MNEQKVIQTLKEIFDKYGMENLRNGKIRETIVKSYIPDILVKTEYRDENMVLTQAMRSDAIGSLVTADVTGDDVKRVLDRLENEEHMRREDAEFTVRCVVLAMGKSPDLLAPDQVIQTNEKGVLPPDPSPTLKPKPKTFKVAVTALVLGVTAMVFITCIAAYIIYQDSPLKAYKSAMDSYERGAYRVAAEDFKDLGYYKNSHDMWQDSVYRSAMDDYDNESYQLAAEGFKDLGDYKDSYEMWQKSMLFYIAANFDNSNTTTYEYLEILDGQGIDCEGLYHRLYDWTVKRAFINTDSSDTETELDSLSRSEKWYVHFLIDGGTPGEQLNIYVKRKSAGDSFYDDDYKEEYTLSDGEYLTNGGWYYKTPSSGKTGTWVMSLFNAETDELLGTATVEIIE